MLSRVLKEDGSEVRPVAWRQTGGAAAHVTEAPRTAAEPQGEASQLRAKVAELTTAAERQARQAYESGFRAGEAAAVQNFEGAVREGVERLAKAIDQVASLRSETIRRAEADTVRLAVEIARRVLHRELSVDTSALEALVKAALEKLQSQEVYRVRVHPDLEKTMRSCLEQTGRGESIDVVKDPVQPKGGAVFEIGRGTLDASVETQLQEIERGLTDQLESRG